MFKNLLLVHSTEQHPYFSFPPLQAPHIHQVCGHIEGRSLFVAMRAPPISRCCDVWRTITTTDTSSYVMPRPQTQANGDSLSRGAALGWMHYLQLTNYMPPCRIALALGSERQITDSPILALRVTKKYTFEMAEKMLAEQRRATSNQTLLCQNERGFTNRAARASCGCEA